MAKIAVLDVNGMFMDTNYLHAEAWAFEDVGCRVPRAMLHHQIGEDSDFLIRSFTDDDEVVDEIQNPHAGYLAELRGYGYPLPGAKDLIL